ncbi:hypothetical protein D7294_07470 [Streptomyces hoynatensis]|uniref:DUF5605 domain-containing protein n=1 Tax=Streptomyces hoynatensis TaxID=1141874 RepID=A0A3A9Z9N9_9ACTN|nr:hypothetical protein D7294_07470 [Streptomyces hoynatensis]
MFELPLPGAEPGDEVVFTRGERRFTSAAFAGERGGCLARFLPDEEGEWRYRSAWGEGAFRCTPAGPGNHGPVRAGESGFRHADGLPFHPFGTTLGEAGDTALRALADGPFNRVRLRCPASLPLDRLDAQVRALLALGIEAEVPLEGRDIRETVSRLAAYRNVWWCAPRDPEAQATVLEHDYGHHPLTVHGGPGTDFGAPWITHVSLRQEETRLVAGLTAELGKPVLIDDCGAEGDAPEPEGSLPAPVLVSRIWEGVCQGGWVTHRETYGPRPWEEGGELRGESAARIAFLRGILAGAPAGLRHNPLYYDASTLEAPGEYCLQYLGPHRYSSRTFALPRGTWLVEVIDAWNMRVGAPRRVRADRIEVALPADPYCAIRVRRAPGA